jgi:cellulose biosynthesis protein BcsQ
MEIITCLSAKGGAAKTTIIAVLAAELVRRNIRVLTVDADTQNSYSKLAGAYSEDDPPKEGQVWLGDLLLADPKRLPFIFSDSVITTKHFGDVIVPGPRLVVQEAEIGGRNAAQIRMQRMLEPVVAAKKYDVILIDVGRQGVLYSNAINAATGVLLAFETSLMGVEAIRQTLASLDELHSLYRFGPDIIGVVPTLYKWNRSVHNIALKTLKEFPYTDYFAYQETIPVLDPFEDRTAFEKMAALGLPPHEIKDFDNPEIYSNCERLVNTVINWVEGKVNGSHSTLLATR